MEVLDEGSTAPKHVDTERNNMIPISEVPIFKEAYEALKSRPLSADQQIALDVFRDNAVVSDRKTAVPPAISEYTEFVARQVELLTSLMTLKGQIFRVDDSVPRRSGVTTVLYAYAGWLSSQGRRVFYVTKCDTALGMHPLVARKFSMVRCDRRFGEQMECILDCTCTVIIEQHFQPIYSQTGLLFHRGPIICDAGPIDWLATVYPFHRKHC